MTTREICTKCGRERPDYIADPTCAKNGYCNWTNPPPVRPIGETTWVGSGIKRPARSTLGRVDASAELIALSMLLAHMSRCMACGCMAEGYTAGHETGPVCLQCWPAWKEAADARKREHDREMARLLQIGPVTPEASLAALSHQCGCLVDDSGCISIQFCQRHFDVFAGGDQSRHLKPAVHHELYSHHRIAARFNALLRGES